MQILNSNSQKNFPFVTGDDKEVYDKYQTNQPFDKKKKRISLVDLLSWHVEEKKIQQYNQEIIINLADKKAHSR